MVTASGSVSGSLLGSDSGSSVVPAVVAPPGQGLAHELGMTRSVAQVLAARGSQDTEQLKQFLDPKLRDLTPPDAMADRGVATERLARAVRAGESVCVFGDYDCDGMTSAAIMTLALRSFGATVAPLVASRFHGGYGVSAEAATSILATGASLVVTCDCGSSDHESLARLKEAGRDVVVIDHHLVPDEPLPVVAFLNPHRPECGFPYKGMASCGLALSLIGAVRTELGVAFDLRAYLDLVAIGTIADIAPLDADNRALVRAGLEVIRRGERPGVRALLEYARLDRGGPLGAEDVAFRIAPRLNAPGRLGRPDAALELLLAKDAQSAQSLAASLEQSTQERRQQQEAIVEKALAMIEAEHLDEKSAIVVGADDWNHGIVGIVAARLVDKFQRPAIVVGFEDGIGRGSARGPRGCRLHDAIAQSAEPLERWGGHQAAAGVTVSAARFQEFREAFEAACDKGAADPVGPIKVDPTYEYFGDDRPADVTRDLHRIEPFGPTNPAPNFSVRAQVLSAKRMKGGHLKAQLKLEGGQSISAFGANLGSEAKVLKGGEIEAVGRFQWDSWRGGDAVELRIDSLRAFS